MQKEGKIELLSVLIASMVIFIVYAVFVLGSDGIDATFPENGTNASATFGHSPSGLNASFNGTAAQFHCTVQANASNSMNITNVSLFISGEPLASDSAIRNQTQNTTVVGQNPAAIIFNVTPALAEGIYYWFCEATDNNSAGASYNTTLNRTFTIDTTPPKITNDNITNTSNSLIGTGDRVSLTINVSDTYTNVDTVRLFVNHSGSSDTEVNVTGGTSGVVTGNNTQVNLSFVIPSYSLGSVLNFTFQVNDSVNNINITQALIFAVTEDNTVPGPINLNTPIDLFNQSSATVEFNFTAYDNNDTSLICNVSIYDSGGAIIKNISNIEAANNTPQTNSTSLSNGLYSWNVTCVDSPLNENVSATRQFTVDQLPPVVSYFNITNSSTFNVTGGGNSAIELGTGEGVSRAQGVTLYAFANFTDNLTQVLQGALQAYNESSSSWVTVSQSPSNYRASRNSSWINLSFTPPTGHNIYEGDNVSFRVVANDTVGNINTTLTIQNITIQINDTTKPTLSVTLGQRDVNGTNTTDTTPTIVWNVTEGNNINYLAMQVDGSANDNCNLRKNFTTIATANANKNGGLTVLDTGGCSALTNGTHTVRLTTEDSWGNSELYIHSFVVQTGEGMSLTVGAITTRSGGVTGGAAINQSNITPYHRLSFNVTLDGGVSTLKNMTWTSSCDTSTNIYTNATETSPFNFSGCKGTEANQTVTVTAYDHVDNSITKQFQFAVDDYAPTLTVHSPVDGARYSDLTQINISAFDSMSRIDSAGFYLDGSNTLNSSLNGTAIGAFLATYQGENVSFISVNANFTPGTHTIKIWANDTLGNERNSSVITFVQTGPIKAGEINNSIASYLRTLNSVPVNVTIRKKDVGGGYGLANTTDIDNTFEIFINLNSSTDLDSINVTITELNGSAANWDKINFSILIDDAGIIAGIENNITADLFDFVYFNSSLDEFINDTNSYFGKVLLPFNISGANRLAQEIWWFSNSDDLTDRTNVSKCTADFSRTTTTPCWNNTGGGKTLVFVPHFSAVGGGNDSRAPTVAINAPVTPQGVSGFVPNVTVSSDATSCKYILNLTDTTKSSATSNVSSAATPITLGNDKVCTWDEVRFKDGAYNITYNVTDASGNINETNMTFEMSDGTASNTPGPTASSVSSSGATITVSNVNESVNATVIPTNGSSFTNGMQTDFSQSQSVTLTGLSSGTTYYYNISLYDFNGILAKNGTFQFTTSPAADEDEEEEESAAGTGTGGGGAAAVSTVSDSKAQVWNSVPAGSSFSLDVDKSTVGITKVTVDNIKSELSDVEIEVQALTKKPVSAAAAAKVFQYLRINKKNIVDSDAETLKISFRVTKSWLDDSNLASNDISLYRYNDNKWNRLAVKVTGTDDTYVNYEAETPGFSYFAIGSKTAASAELQAILDMIDSFYATGSPSLIEILDAIDAYYSAGGA